MSDTSVLPGLLLQLPEDEVLESLTGDGAYDTQPVHETVIGQGSPAIIPPRKNARLGGSICKHWSGYHRRSLAETKMYGSKKDFTSLPYKNIVAYSVETSDTLDLDSELEIYFSPLGKVKFEFTGKTAIVEISKLISAHIFA